MLSSIIFAAGITVRSLSVWSWHLNFAFNVNVMVNTKIYSCRCLMLLANIMWRKENEDYIYIVTVCQLLLAYTTTSFNGIPIRVSIYTNILRVICQYVINVSGAFFSPRIICIYSGSPAMFCLTHLISSLSTTIKASINIDYKSRCLLLYKKAVILGIEYIFTIKVNSFIYAAALCISSNTFVPAQHHDKFH